MTKRVNRVWGSLSLALTISTFVPSEPLVAEGIEPSSPRWEKAIQAFEASDKSNPVEANSTLFIGSSSIRMWKTLASDFPNLKVINRGFGGSQIIDSIFFASRIVIPYAPEKIFLYAGDNDIAAGKSAETVLKDFRLFATMVHQSLPDTEVYFLAIKPSLKRWSLAAEMKKANGLVAHYTNQVENLGYVDVWTPMLEAAGKPDPALFIQDGLHMNSAGYKVWAEAVRPFL